MDRVDAMILAILAALDLVFLLHLRWRRGKASRVERRVSRSLKASIEERTPD